MKNIIERIVGGGAKIARYLPKAVSTRLAVAALAALAAGGALAMGSLEETGGFVTETSTLAFKGMTLDEITATTLHGRVGGGWMSGKVGNPWGFYLFDRSVSGQLKCEAQIDDGGTIKGVRLVFTQTGDDVYVATDGTGAAAMRYKTDATLGESLFVDGTTTPSGNGSDTAYRVYNLHLPRSYYRFNGNMPAVVWDGDFEQTKYDGNGNAYTLTRPTGITLSNGTSGNLVVGSDATTGASVAIPATGTNIAVLVKYSGLAAKDTQAFAPIGIKDNGDQYIGFRPTANNALTVKGYYDGHNNLYPTTGNPTATLAEGSGYFMISYNCRNGGNGSGAANNTAFRVYAGASIVALAGGECTGLRFTGDTKAISTLYLGGPGSTSRASAWAGLTIEKVAIYYLDRVPPMSVSTDDKSKMFFRPRTTGADASAYYEKFGNANAILTWKTAADAAGNNGDFMAYADVKYNIFNPVTGTDSGEIATGGATAGNVAAWQRFCYGQSAYNAPGQVLRLVSGYYSNIHGKFSPLSLGGLIVESGATGYVVSQSDNNRSFSLGDPTGNGESYFEVNEDFTINRTAGGALMGTVNIDVADGKTFTFASNAQIAKAWNSVSGGTGLPTVNTAGGALKFHGAGQLAVPTLTATGSTLDYSDLAAARATPFVSGALAVDGDTVFKFPAGAVFPYPVATSVSSTASGDVAFYVGSTAYMRELLFNNGNASPAERRATFEGGESAINWSDLPWDITYSDESSAVSRVTASASGTLVLGNISTGKVVLDVPSGVTLTLTGEITVSDHLHITGEGAVDMTRLTVIGVFGGDGTVVFDYAGANTTLPSTLAEEFVTKSTTSNEFWTGTLWLKNYNSTDKTSKGLYPNYWCNSGSKLKFTNVYGYLPGMDNAGHWTLGYNNGSCLGELILEDDGDNVAYTRNDGYSHDGTHNSYCMFAKLSGSGTLADSKSQTIYLVFKDVSEFEGKFNLSQNTTVIIGDSSPRETTNDGKIVIDSDKEATVAADKTWAATRGFAVNGMMTLNGALSGTVTGSGTIVCGQSVDLSGSGFDNSANWTGTVRLNGDATPMPSTLYDETSYGNASSTLEIASGSVAITEATTLPGTVNVASSASLFVTSSATELTLAGSNSGTINLSMASALTTLNLNLTGNGTISYPASLTTLNVRYNESLADDGVKEITATGTALTDGTMTLVRPDGTEESVTGTVSGNKITFTWTPTVSGAACWVAYEMEYESGTTTGFENSGSDTTALSSNGVTGSDAFTDDGMLYTYAHPYRNDITTDSESFPDNWTAVVRCTVPDCTGAAVITFGWKNSLIGLVAGDNPETEMKLVKSTDSNYETLATMTVQNATSAQHVYVFSVENSSTVKVHCDGEQVLNQTYSTFTVRRGFQIGSVLGGADGTGITRFWKGESPANTLSETVQKAARIDCVRLYKTVLGPNAIAALTEEFPAVKLYRATVAADATTTWDALTWSPAWDGGNEYSKIILTAAGDGTLTLPESIKADEFIVNVAADSTLTLAKASGGSAMTVSKLEINDGKVAVADANFFGSRVINGTGTLKITDTGALTSALSGNAKFEIPSGVGVGVMPGGAIASTMTGAGELSYISAADVPGSALSFSAWTGTVVLPAFTGGEIALNNYGVAGSTVRVSGSAGYLKGDHSNVIPNIELGGDWTLPNFSASFANTLAKLSGTYKFTLGASQISYENDSQTPYFLIKDVSDFTGSLETTAAGIVLGAASKPTGREHGGKILVYGNVTVGETATWTAPNGVLLADANATLTVPSGATVPVPTTSVAGCVVKATAGESTTVYSVAAQRTATVSVGTNASLSINGNAVADGNTVKFVPGDVLTITASADTYYTPALTVNEVSQTSPYELTTTDADVTVSVTATLDTYTITIPVVANTTVSVSYTSGGEAQVATAAGAITVDAGTSLTAIWTAVSGYRITANAGQTINPVVATQTLTSPTVEEMSAVVSNVNFTYGADYTTAEVTATIAGEATSATLTYGSNTYNAQVSNGTVTFTDVVVSRDSGNIYAPVSYTITTDAHATTGGAGSAVAADTTAWFSQSSANSGAPVNGSWATAVDLSEPATVEDNTFTATAESTSSRVVLEFNVCFSSVSDADVDGTAQAAIKIGEVESAATFMVLAPNSSWTPVSNADLTPDPAETYKVVLTIDYGTGSYGVTVGDNALTNASGSASFPLAATRTGVQNIDFAGSGTLTSMKGDQVEGYMVKDNAGHWYATIQEATQAYNSANGPYTVLHSGTAPSGWKIDGNTLIKLAKGFFFMAY